MLIYLSRSQIAITHGFHIKKDSVGQKKTKKNANPLVTQHQNNCLSACELAGSFIETMLIYERTAITYGFRSRRVRSGNKLRDLSGTTHTKKNRERIRKSYSCLWLDPKLHVLQELTDGRNLAERKTK